MFLSLFLYCVPLSVHMLSHGSLNQGNNPSHPAFCGINSFNPFLPVGTGNNPTLSASHHTKNIPFSFSKVQNFCPHHMSITQACLQHEPQLTLDKTPPPFIPVKMELWQKKIQSCSSSVEKPRNSTFWEWVFSQTLPAEWREPQIYSVIKIVFFHFIFHYMASFFLLCCSILWALKKCLCILVHWGLGILLENSTPRGNCAINSMRMPPSAINTACAK